MIFVGKFVATAMVPALVCQPNNKRPSLEEIKVTVSADRQDKVGGLITACWHSIPDVRPKFTGLLPNLFHLFSFLIFLGLGARGVERSVTQSRMCLTVGNFKTLLKTELFRTAYPD